MVTDGASRDVFGPDGCALTARLAPADELKQSVKILRTHGQKKMTDSVRPVCFRNRVSTATFYPARKTGGRIPRQTAAARRRRLWGLLGGLPGALIIAIPVINAIVLWLFGIFGLLMGHGGSFSGASGDVSC